MSLFQRLVPFLFMGILIFMILVGVIFLYYLLILGAIIGLILYVAGWIRAKFFAPKVIHPRDIPHQRQGRIIDHDDSK